MIPADTAKVTLDAVWIGIGMSILRAGPAEDTTRYLNHLHALRTR